MKNIQTPLTILVLILFIVSCKKEEVKTKYRYTGYIYNEQDSLPFKNTQFKIYYFKPANLTNKFESEEDFFYTDSEGHFDVTSEVAGLLVWPSYIYGSAYIGPPDFGTALRSENDDANKILTRFYDTIYTEPYH